MSIQSSLKKLFYKIGDQAFDADRYWEDRHRSFRGGYKAVGDMRLSDTHNREQYAMKQDRVTGAIRKEIPDPSGKTLLEAGCGIGLLTAAFVEIGFEVVAVDFSPTALTQATTRTDRAHFVRSRLAQLELNRTFDVITVIDVLLHITEDGEWEDTLRTLARHLTPTGVMIVVEWIGDWVGPLGDHCKMRPMSQYVASLTDAGLIIGASEEIFMEHERVKKNLLTIRHAGN